MGLFEDLSWRGIAHQWTGGDDLPARLGSGPITVYCGFDPSAPSLHIGNLMQLTLLRRLQRAGHRPIAIAGGATGMVGDPTGRSQERNLLSDEAIEANVTGIREQIGRFLDFDAPGNPALVLNNADWFRDMSFVAFLRDVGKHFSVNVMLARESVKARLEGDAGISYTEFSYMLMQAYDFVHLHETYGCEMQTGGSDQYGNITAGVDLGRRMRGAHLFGLTTPLVTRSDGVKMGKTAAGAVWMDERLTSPYAFYQWFVRAPDADAGSFLRLFTEVPQEEIRALEASGQANPARRDPQRRLARELTELVHGEGGLARAERATAALFGGDLQGLNESELLEIFADVASAEVPATRLGSITVTDAFVESALVRSRGEARRLVDGGGAYVGNRRMESADAVLGATELSSETIMVLRAGKRSFALLRFLR
ncbi:MAG: tyrosine--tRNA ligase [Actinomycetota bacterium]